MEKQSLLSIIDKYYLNGIGEKVKWSVKDKNVTLKTFSPNKNMVGIITAPIDLPDGDFLIFDTSKFIKLISICGQFLTMEVEYNGKIATKIKISDKEYDLEYALANLMLAPQINIEVEEFPYNYSFKINKELSDKWLKAKKALGTEVCNIGLQYNSKIGIPEVVFTLGDPGSHANKISFNCPELKSEPGEFSDLPFNADFVKEILESNYKSEGVAYVNNDGAIKMEFETEDGQKSSYIVLANLE